MLLEHLRMRSVGPGAQGGDQIQQTFSGIASSPCATPELLATRSVSPSIPPPIFPPTSGGLSMSGAGPSIPSYGSSSGSGGHNDFTLAQPHGATASSPHIPPPQILRCLASSVAGPLTPSYGSSSSSSGHNGPTSAQTPQNGTASSHNIPPNGPSTSGVGTQLHYLISEVQHIRREMEASQRQHEFPSPKKSRTRGHGEFKANSPSKPCTSARSEMMVSMIASI
jgi:hypothetical protein